jgi:hypothetical protein
MNYVPVCNRCDNPLVVIGGDDFYALCACRNIDCHEYNIVKSLHHVKDLESRVYGGTE